MILYQGLVAEMVTLSEKGRSRGEHSDFLGKTA